MNKENTYEKNVAINCFSVVITPDWKLLLPPTDGVANLWIIGMGCLESSFFYQTAPSINSQNDPNLPALLVYMQYLTQAEVSYTIFVLIILLIHCNLGTSMETHSW